MGSGGWEGYTVGFTLVGCIVAGAGAGYLLDSHFKTSYWLPLLFLIGVAGGFREMWIVIQRVQKQEEQKRREKREATPLATPPVQGEAQADNLPERKRAFQVPPPPFENQGAAVSNAAPESSEELLKRLLAESDGEGSDENKR